MIQESAKDEWVANSKKVYGQLFSEIDVILRALDRFFNDENLMISNEDLTGRNFYDELVTVRDTILRLLGMLEVVIPENKKIHFFTFFQKWNSTRKFY